MISKLDCFAANDSAPMRLAAAMQLPTVGLYGPTNPTRTAPLGAIHKVSRAGTQLDAKHTLTSQLFPTGDEASETSKLRITA